MAGVLLTLLILMVTFNYVTAIYNERQRVAKGGDLNKKYPFVAAVQIYSGSNVMYTCGCAIISLDYILTSADCLDAGSDFETEEPLQTRIIAGSADLSAGGSLHLIKSTHFPNDYEDDAVHNNIALAEVTPSFRPGDKLNIIILQTEPLSINNAKVYFAGWGSFKKENKKQLYPESLKHTKLETITNDECRQFNMKINDKQVCTLSYIGQGLCNGDQGGPLVGEKTPPRLLAIATKKYSCGSGFPDVFIKVEPFIDWINSTCECI